MGGRHHPGRDRHDDEDGQRELHGAGRAAEVASLLDGIVVEAITTGRRPDLGDVQARVLSMVGLAERS